MMIEIVQSLKYRYWYPLLQSYILKKVAKHGTDVSIGEHFSMSNPKNIHIGNHVYIGPYANFLCSDAIISIGNYCMLGPEVMIITGDHRTNVPGEYMYNVKEKLPENDRSVVIEDDVWIGARALILKGVKIGKGSVIAAGAIVLKDVPSYSLYISQDKILPRFTSSEMEEHLRKMK